MSDPRNHEVRVLFLGIILGVAIMLTFFTVDGTLWRSHEYSWVEWQLNSANNHVDQLNTYVHEVERENTRLRILTGEWGMSPTPYGYIVFPITEPSPDGQTWVTHIAVMARIADFDNADDAAEYAIETLPTNVSLGNLTLYRTLRIPDNQKAYRLWNIHSYASGEPGMWIGGIP